MYISDLSIESCAYRCMVYLQLYQIVVDTEQTGKKLLQHGQLKRRVTIIPLNKVSARCIDDQKIRRAEQLVSICIYQEMSNTARIWKDVGMFSISTAPPPSKGYHENLSIYPLYSLFNIYGMATINSALSFRKIGKAFVPSSIFRCQLLLLGYTL